MCVCVFDFLMYVAMHTIYVRVSIIFIYVYIHNIFCHISCSYVYVCIYGGAKKTSVSQFIEFSAYVKFYAKLTPPLRRLCFFHLKTTKAYARAYAKLTPTLRPYLFGKLLCFS